VKVSYAEKSLSQSIGVPFFMMVLVLAVGWITGKEDAEDDIVASNRNPDGETAVVQEILQYYRDASGNLTREEVGFALGVSNLDMKAGGFQGHGL